MKLLKIQETWYMTEQMKCPECGSKNWRVLKAREHVHTEDLYAPTGYDYIFFLCPKCKNIYKLGEQKLEGTEEWERQKEEAIKRLAE